MFCVTAPLPVVGLVVEAAETSVLLSWRASGNASECRPTRYEVRLKTLSAGSVFIQRTVSSNKAQLFSTKSGLDIHWRLSGLQSATQYELLLSPVDSSSGLVGGAVQDIFTTKSGGEFIATNFFVSVPFSLCLFIQLV